TGINSSFITSTAPIGGMIIESNVGIGSLTPGQKLDVQGTVRTKFFAMSGQTPVSGYVMTASDSAGDTTWTASGAVSGWTVSGNNVYETLSGNVGIGTTLVTTSALTVMNGNVGIGTWKPTAKLFVAGSDPTAVSIAGEYIHLGDTAQNVNGYRLIGFGYETAEVNPNAYIGFQDTSAAGSGKGELVFGTRNVTSDTIPTERMRIATTGNVGIGTFVPNDLLHLAGGANAVNEILFTNTVTGNAQSDGVVMGMDTGQPAVYFWANENYPMQFGTNDTERVRITQAGNVGIGTTTPVSKLAIVGNVGIGTVPYDAYITTTAPNGGMIIENNVGIGSLTPGQKLDVQGTVRTVSFAMSGQTPVSGYVMTASDSAGDTTWTASGAVSGWTITNTNDVYETNKGNVGIGTTKTSTAALTIMNGNVGIGTWVSGSLLDVIATQEGAPGFVRIIQT
ncbi:MAG: hypothetical protein ACREGC_02300, partial [Minisyncoccia bacterium]